MPFRLAWASAMLAAGLSAQIHTLATTGDGGTVYFSTGGSLRPRGSSEPFAQTTFRWSGKELTQVDRLLNAIFWYQGRPSVSASGAVVAINREMLCPTRTCPPWQPRLATRIETPAQTFTFPARAAVSANGRFATLHGLSKSSTVQLVDLESGVVTELGRQVGSAGSVVSDDGTVLIWRWTPDGEPQGVYLVGPSASGPLKLAGEVESVALARDTTRIVYDSYFSNVVGAEREIHVFDVKTGTDRTLGTGSGVTLAHDGRRFSYLRKEGEPALPGYRGTQVWVGDAVTGATRRLSTEAEGIVDQAMAGDGRAVIAVTASARLLSIDTPTGEVTELLGSPGPQWLVFQAVPGSYNEVAGEFPDGPPEVLIGKTAAVVLGPSPRGYAIQIPWEAPTPPPYPQVIVRGREPLWELLVGTVQSRHPVVLPIGPTGPIGPVGMLQSYLSDVDYGIRENWSGPVNADNPVRPGEVVHFFGSGWGAVDGAVRTGQPTPTDRPYRLVEACDWRAAGSASTRLEALRPFEVLFAGLAPGLVGVYQIDLRIPADWNENEFRGYCVWSMGEGTIVSALPALPVRP